MSGKEGKSHSKPFLFLEAFISCTSDHSHQWICVYSTSNLIYNAKDELHVEGAANDKNQNVLLHILKVYILCVFVFSTVIACQQSLYGRLTLSLQINCSVGSRILNVLH